MREHGTRARYVHGPDWQDRPKAETGVGCRCGQCVMANRAYARQNTRQRAYGRSPWVTDKEAAAVRAHLTALRAEGLGLRVIAQRSGVSRSALADVVAGERMRHDTAQRLLDVPLHVPLADGSLVDATLTWKRIDALLEAGYTKVWIARQIGQARALQLRRTQVTARNARLIAEVHRRFITMLPPKRSAVACCATRGEVCRWTARSDWFCTRCGYALHECPPTPAG